MNTIKKLNNKDFEFFFKVKINKILNKEIINSNLSYREINIKEYFYYINDLINITFNQKYILSGNKYKKKWENGWGYNFKILKKKKNINSLIPGYSDKFRIAQVKNRLIKTVTKNFLFKAQKIILSFIFDKYLKKFKYIVEFGTGTGHNLVALYKKDTSKFFYGLDWSSSSEKIFKLLKKKYPKIFFRKFNFFNPKNNLQFKKNLWSGFTFGALEQVGYKYKKFFHFLQKTNPGIVVHLEPIEELLNKDNLLDNLSINYIEKRNYLRGYLDFLKEKEKKNIIKIISIRKSYFGDFRIKAFSLIVWKFNKK